MTTNSISAEAARSAVEIAERIVEACGDDLDRQPTLQEFLSVLGFTLPVDAKLNTSKLPIRYKARLSGGNVVEASDSPPVELNDAAFDDANDLIIFLAGQISDETATRTEIRSVATAIGQVLATSEIEFHDFPARAIFDVTADVAERIFRPHPGDVLAIPVKGSKYRLALVVADNRFGYGIAFAKESQANARPPRDTEIEFTRVVYTDENEITSGAWRWIAHIPKLLNKMPKEPELYHRPNNIWSDESTSIYGSAESPDGAVREIGEEEARKVGMNDKNFRHIYVSSYLDNLLKEGNFC
jgi:hypothetical protein